LAKATLTSDSDSTSTDGPITDNKGVNKVKNYSDVESANDWCM